MATKSLSDLIVRLSLDTSQFTEGMSKFESSVKKIQDTFKSSVSGITDFDSVLQKLQTSASTLQSRLESQQKTVADLTAKYKASADATGEDSEKTQRLAQQLETANSKMKQTEAALKLVNDEITKNSNGWYQFGTQLEGIGDKMESVGKKISSTGKTMSTTLTLPIVALGTAATKASVDFESGMTGVKKTVDGTEADFERLGEAAMEMSERMDSTTGEILGVMESAGQLGIELGYGGETITKFTEVMIMLGDTTNLSAEQAATSLAKFMNVMKTSTDDVDRLGAVIVDLGNNMATTEADIVEMGQRLAAAGKVVGMSESQVMAFSAALSSVGIEAEAGGSAFSKLMVNMNVAAVTGSEANKVLDATGMSLRELQLMADADSKGFKELAQSLGYTSTEFKSLLNSSADLENFASVAGMTSEQFVKAFEEDAGGAIMAFVEGLAAMDASGQDAISILDAMGITEVRLRNAILSSVNASELFGESQEIASEAWRENMALTDEAAKRYETTESKLNQFKNSLSNLGVAFGDVIVPYLTQAIEKISGLVDWLRNLDDGTKNTIVTVAGIAAVVGPLLIVIGKIITSIGTISSAIGGLITKIASATAGSGGFSGALSALLSPAGLAIAAIGVLAAVILTLKRNQDEANQALLDMLPSVTSFNGAVDSMTPKVADANKLLSDTGKTLGDIDTQIAECETAITTILASALEEQRTLRESDLESIREYTTQLYALELEKLGIYRDQMLAEMLKVNLEIDTLTQEQAAQRLNNAQSWLDEANRATEDAYTSQLTIIENKYRTMGQIGSDAYNAELRSAQEFYTDSLSENSDYYSNVLQAVTTAMLKWESVDTEAWDNIVASNKKSQDESISNMRNYGDSFIYDLMRLSKKTEENKERYAAALAAMDLDSWNAFLSIQSGVVEMGGTLSTESETAVEAMMNAFSDLPDGCEEIAKQSLLGLVSGIEQELLGVEDASDMTAQEIIDAMRETLGIHSPSTVMKEIGRDVVEGVREGISAQQQSAKTEVKSVGTGLVEGIWSGISEKWSWLSGKISGFVGSITDAFKRFLGINSPSTLFRDEIGQFIPEGVAVGIEESTDKVAAAMRGMMDTVSDATANIDVSTSVNAGGATRVRSIDTIGNASSRISNASASVNAYGDQTASTRAIVDALGKRRTVDLDDVTIQRLAEVLFERFKGAMGDTILTLDDRELGRAVRALI